MAQATVWAHATVLPPEPASAGKARDFVCLHLVEHRLLYLVEDIRLVASEMATIAMVHVHESFTLSLEEVEGAVRIMVTEGAPPPDDHVVGGRPDLGGQALSVVDGVSCAWGVDADDNGARSLWASFAVRARSS